MTSIATCDGIAKSDGSNYYLIEILTKKLLRLFLFISQGFGERASFALLHRVSDVMSDSSTRGVAPENLQQYCGSGDCACGGVVNTGQGF
jgi:hypothetical protein